MITVIISPVSKKDAQMVSNSCKQGGKNWSDNVFGLVPVGPGEAALLAAYLGDQDYAANSRRALLQDFRKFAAWFAEANAEPFRVKRVTTRDVTDFKDALREIGDRRSLP